MSASVTMAVMAASARAALDAADGALPSGVNRAPAGERGARYEMKSSALKTDVIPNKTNVMMRPLR